ncbi:MAG: (2Fe-2S)-binding protein [Acidobacteriota bacterium]
MSLYPDEINERAAAAKFAGKAAHESATGVAASFRCGSFVRFCVDIDPASLIIREIKFLSNGCGYAVAIADRLAEAMAGRLLTDLHGLDRVDELESIASEFGVLPDERKQCAEICFGAMSAALADFRERRVQEFVGERALICSCFGVGEDTIERAIETDALDSVEQVAAITNAGSGCGSCRMVIQEMIDTRGL